MKYTAPEVARELALVISTSSQASWRNFAHAIAKYTSTLHASLKTKAKF